MRDGTGPIKGRRNLFLDLGGGCHVAEWAYRALGQDGKLIIGKDVAVDRDQLADILRGRGAILMDSKEKTAADAPRVGRGRVDPRALIEFSSQLAMLFRSGVPLVVGLGDLVDELEDPRLKPVLSDVYDRVSKGERLSSAFARHPRVFADDYVQIVISGEESGELAGSLERLASSMEWRMETARRFKSAFAYPAALLVAVTGLIVLIVTFLVPRLSQIFVDAGVELPLLTRMTLDAADFLNGNVGLICALIGGLILTILIMKRSTGGRARLHRMLLGLPLAGPLALMMESARFSNTMGLLLNSGVPLVRSLEITTQATRNLVVRGKVREIHDSVLRGKRFSESLRAAGGFPSLVLRMVAIGEQTGSMVESLDRVTAYFDKEVPRRIKKFLGILEPAITVTMGAAVCFAVFSAFLPMMKLLGALRG